MVDALFTDSLLPRQPQELAPGVIHLPGWLSVEQQDFLVAQFHRWGAGSIPPHHPEIYGKKMSVKLTSLGWHWSNYSYSRSAPEFGGRAPASVPDWLVGVGRKALQDAYSSSHASSWPQLSEPELATWAGTYSPDMALINYYAPGTSMGMHQDKEERSSAPVVSLSIGQTALFRAGNTETKTRPYQDILLASGDLLVFGGPSRFMYHGVPKLLEGTTPSGCLLPEGRINITLRVTGLHASEKLA